MRYLLAILLILGAGCVKHPNGKYGLMLSNPDQAEDCLDVEGGCFDHRGPDIDTGPEPDIGPGAFVAGTPPVSAPESEPEPEEPEPDEPEPDEPDPDETDGKTGCSISGDSGGWQ